jgi:transcriptional regulator with XRE-family HTH domain
MSAMTTQTATGVRPADTFPVRLAIVRAVHGWNYDQAAKATGIGAETWRTWEKGKRHCTDVPGVAAKIAAATGLDPVWIVFGGALAAVASDASGNADNLHNTWCASRAGVTRRDGVDTDSCPPSPVLVRAA